MEKVKEKNAIFLSQSQLKEILMDAIRKGESSGVVTPKEIIEGMVTKLQSK